MNTSSSVPAGVPQDDVKSTPTPVTQKPQEFGRIDNDGNVWVRDGEQERMVGGYPDGAPEDPFALYVRRYLDLEATIKLFETRLPALSARDIDTTLQVLREQTVQPAAVGDLPGLRARVSALESVAKVRKDEINAERAAAKEESLSIRKAIVLAAEEIAAQNVESTQWKQSGQKLRDLLDQWKDLQKKGPRLDKQIEDSLWKRFSSARTSFDRNRRQLFAAMDASQAEAKAEKEQLIAAAEALQDSTEWGPTSGAYRELMEKWKLAGRASRKEDDALWARFRAAQQIFFDKRRTKDEATNAEFAANLDTKESILVEAETLVPVSDLAAAKTKLRELQDRWEAAGKVPSRDVSRIEGRLRGVEQAIHTAEEQEWRRSNPETQARAQGMFAQLEDSISELATQKAAAEAAGNSKKAADIEEALATKRAWLAQVSSSLN